MQEVPTVHLIHEQFTPNGSMVLSDWINAPANDGDESGFNISAALTFDPHSPEKPDHVHCPRLSLTCHVKTDGTANRFASYREHGSDQIVPDLAINMLDDGSADIYVGLPELDRPVLVSLAEIQALARSKVVNGRDAASPSRLPWSLDRPSAN